MRKLFFIALSVLLIGCAQFEEDPKLRVEIGELESRETEFRQHLVDSAGKYSELGRTEFINWITTNDDKHGALAKKHLATSQVYIDLFNLYTLQDENRKQPSK